MAKDKAVKNTEQESGSTPVVASSKRSNYHWYFPTTWNWRGIVGAIIGLGALFGALSIIFSTYTIINGTEGIVPLIMVIPQAVVAAYILIKQFIKT